MILFHTVWFSQITDDRKEDWWTIQEGKTIRPREELIKEFFDITGIRILIYNADIFLTLAKDKKILPKLKNETIEEVKNIRVSDETYINSIVVNPVNPWAAMSLQADAIKNATTSISNPISNNLTDIEDMTNMQAQTVINKTEMLREKYLPEEFEDTRKTRYAVNKNTTKKTNTKKGNTNTNKKAINNDKSKYNQ